MWPSALVHLFTAMGVVCALMATRCVLLGAWEALFAWLAVALAIDTLDGTFARWVGVSERLPRFSGERLDLVIDYLTYVFIPALALLQAGFLPGSFGLVLACLILLSSLFHFSDTASKAADHSFVGFPAIWNVVAFYVFALDLQPTSTALLILGCVVLTFIPLKWVHPMRTVALRPVTVLSSLLAGIAGVSVLLSGFPASGWQWIVLVLAAVYGVALTLYSGYARDSAPDT
jgi:phosphatidylcholine synthase